ncbi:MAG: hypothetical protein QM582_10090 [Micropruina sp.]|uniref:hypothetical protein n=1 Tax=Micropruina sp. TaxID=2737536 RepID=UPI0039E24501
MGDMHKNPRRLAEKALSHAAWLDEYINGSTMAAIADRHDVAKSTVHEAIHRRLQEARDRRNDLGDLLLELQISRYTDLYRRCIDELDSADDGREVGKAQLIASARSILDSLTKVLGYDKGTTITVTGESAIDRDIRDLTTKMALQLDQIEARDH